GQQTATRQPANRTWFGRPLISCSTGAVLWHRCFALGVASLLWAGRSLDASSIAVAVNRCRRYDGRRHCGYVGMTALHPRQPHWRAPLSILVWLVLQSIGAAGSATDAAPSAELRQVADGVFVRPGQTGVLFEADNVANLGVVIGNRCVAVIDTGGSKSEGKALAAAIGKLTDVPVCFVINTHVHPDHLLGNEAFSTGQVRFIGHEKLPGAMAARGELYLRRAAEYSGGDAGVEMVAPEQTVRDEVQIDLGNRVLVVRAFATAHTDNDLT